MEESDIQIHSFVVKIWTEEVIDPRRDPSWRGYVTHVGTGKRQYVERLLQIPAFMIPYLEDAGGTVDDTTRACLWIADAAPHQPS